MSTHELLNFRIRVPLFAVNFVSTDVEKLVREKLRHLTNKLVEKFVRAFARGIHRWVEHSPLPLNRVRSGRAGQIGISYEPCRAMPRHIELGNHPNTAVVRISNYFAHLLLGVKQAV